MTYAVFLLLFLVPPIVVLLVAQPRPLAGVGGVRARAALPLTCLIAFAYTTPWDNYLVYSGVWGYGPDRVLATIGYVPVEEYLFFLLQPILTGLFLYRLLAVTPPNASPPNASPPNEPRRSSALFYAGLVFSIAITVAGVLCLLGGDESRYLGLILAWVGPVLVGMWAYAGRHILRWGRVAAVAVAVPTVYLWVADRIAIGLDIWYIEPRYSLAFRPFGLPVEEAVFFLATNLLVVFGVLLFLHGDRIATARAAASSN